MTALVLGLLDVGGIVTLWQVYLIAFALGLVAAIDTPTRQAFVSELVGQEQLPNAIGLNSATFNAGRIMGPAVAGVLIDPIGTGPVFLINAGSYVAVIIGLSLMRDRELFLGKRTGRGPGQIRAGLEYVRRRPDLMLPMILAGIVGTFAFNFQMTTALLAKETFHRSASGYGLLSTLLAVGSLGGALLAARRSRPRRSLLLGSTIGFGTLTLAAGLMPTYLWFAVSLVPTGVLALTFSTTANSAVQMGSSPAMRGRVMALYMLVFAGGTPIGAPFVGWLAEQLGARWSLISGGLITIVTGLVATAVVARMSHVRVVPHVRPRPWIELQPQRRVTDDAMFDEVRSA
jgi:MFS family permease